MNSVKQSDCGVNIPKEFEGRPEIEVAAVNNCPVCGHSQFDLYSCGYDYELRTCINRWQFVGCADCGHVWLNPRPSVSELPVIYPPNYYAYNYDTQVHPVARWGKRLLDQFKIKGILRSMPALPKTYLDVGCGDGRYLDVMLRAGLAASDIHGLELNDQITQRLRERGYRAFCSRVENCEEIPFASLDLITMFHVIEHVDDPGAVIRRLVSWLRPGGVLAIETPNIDSLDAHWCRRSHWGGYHFPRHWNLFSRSTLQRVLEANGLEVKKTSYQTGHSFWMYSCHHALRYGSVPRPWLASWFDPFSNWPFLAAFTAWDRLRASIGCRTSAMLMTANKPRIKHRSQINESGKP